MEQNGKLPQYKIVAVFQLLTPENFQPKSVKKKNLLD